MNEDFGPQEIFDASGLNDVKRVRELLDCGVDINLQDHDKGNTPLHVAASRGSKQVMELLVMRGCDVNPQDNRGSTPLHSLIYKRYDALALWLVRQGADIHKADKRGFSPTDQALGWFQKELADAAAGKPEKDENAPATTAATPVASTPKQDDSKVNIPAEEVLKVFLKNNSYKSIKMTKDETALDLVKKMAAKLNMPEHEKHMEVLEIIKEQTRHVPPTECILRLKAKWPVIFGKSGNETLIHCHFLVAIKRTAPPEVHQALDRALV